MSIPAPQPQPNPIQRRLILLVVLALAAVGLVATAESVHPETTRLACSYVNGNPVNLSDPNGHEPHCVSNPKECLGFANADRALGTFESAEDYKVHQMREIRRRASKVGDARGRNFSAGLVSTLADFADSIAQSSLTPGFPWPLLKWAGTVANGQIKIGDATVNTSDIGNGPVLTPLLLELTQADPQTPDYQDGRVLGFFAAFVSGGWGSGAAKAAESAGTRITTTAAKSTDEVADIGHAGLRHQFPNTLPRKSQFYDDINLGSLSSRTKGLDGIVQPNGNTRYVLRNPGGVGVDRTTGLPTDVFTVIRRPNGSVVTMFPGTSPKG